MRNNEESNGLVATEIKMSSPTENNGKIKINGENSSTKEINLNSAVDDDTKETHKLKLADSIATAKADDGEKQKNEEKMDVSVDDDVKLRKSIEELNAANNNSSIAANNSSCSEASPRKPVKNTFYGGVRYFASLLNDDETLSETEASPFEPSKPRFHTIRKGRKGLQYDVDTGERPFALFGDIEDKIGTSGDESDAYAPNSSSTISEHLNMHPVVSLEKLDKSLDKTLAKPANWANLTCKAETKKPRGRPSRKSREVVSTPNESTKDTSQESTPQTNEFSTGAESSGRRTRGKRIKFTEPPDDEFDYNLDDDDEDAELEPRKRKRRGRRRKNSDEEFASIPVPRGPKLPPVPKILQQPQRVHTIWPKRPIIPPRQMLRPKGAPTLDVYQEQQAQEQAKAANASPPQLSKQKFMETVLVIKPYQQQEKRHINQTMFANMRFVLTSATRPKDAPDKSEEEENPPAIPFNKRQIRQLIEERSGTVYEDFSQLADVTNCYLVADTHYRTHKYLSALVRAVPCVSHMWIFECVKENRLLPHDEFLLSAGKGLETNQLIPWHDKCLTLLNGIKMFVYSENKPVNPAALDFIQIWTPIARSMGAIMVETLSETTDDPSSKFDILMTDTSCPEEIITKAKALNATPVSSEWLIQAILTGVLPSTSGHQKYQHDFVEPIVNNVS